MKVDARVLDVETNFGGECIPMGIDTEAMAHIMSSLIDLYSDPELAVIREYSTNAFDAHVEAGVTRPIEITLPLALSPFLKIRDYGEGLDGEDIREVYSKYGASTKRNSNKLTGMLGFGCKSALTYSDQFMVSGTKNGITTQISVSRDEDGAGSMTLVDKYESTDPSGVEITIPTKKYNDFEDTAKNFFRFWKKGTVLVNGEEPKRVDGFWVAEDLLLTQDVEQDMVVMGNVPYPMNESYGYNRGGYNLVAYVPIGSVAFTPSREALQFNTKTKETIATVKERVEVERETAIEKQISDATDPLEALKVAMAGKALGYMGKPSFQGVEIPLTYEFSDLVTVVAGVKKHRVKDWGRMKSLFASAYSKSVFFHGYTSDSFSPYKRAKLEQWIENQTDFNRPENFVLLERVPRDLRKWLRKDQIVSWTNGPDKEKIVRTGSGAPKNSSGRVTGSYTGYVAGEYQHELLAEDIDYSKGLYYTDLRWNDDRSIVDHLKPEATVIALGGNRVKKFERDFPMAESLSSFNYQSRNDWKDNVSEDDRLWVYLKRHNKRSILVKFDHTRITNETLANTVKLMTENRPEVEAEMRVFGDCPAPIDTSEHTAPLANYPLLDNSSYYCYNDQTALEHVYLYITAVDAAEEGSK